MHTEFHTNKKGKRARNMLADGLSIDAVSKYTKLDPEALKDLE